jgi:Caspase domain/Domain of unknown function (DUF4384)
MKRRQFFQLAGSTALLSASEAIVSTQLAQSAQRLGSMLGQSGNRKLALLVGINAYPQGIRPLKGCLNDVALQRELLIHRFGFLPQDIVTLTDRAATRSGIVTTFEQHLIGQAKPGDVVVFHYSGHGSRVVDPDPISADGLNGTLVPYDYQTSSADVNAIMGRSLYLLTAALPTDQVTMVLDACYAGGGLGRNQPVTTEVVRAIESRAPSGNAPTSAADRADQQRWLQHMGLSPQAFKQRRQRGIALGVALGAAQRDQLATDTPFSDFHAGAFTYLLTRSLWQDSGSLGKIFIDLARRTKDIANSAGIVQVPLYEVAPNTSAATQPTYFAPSPTSPAEAVVQKVQGDQVQFWLGGISPESLLAFETGAVFRAADGSRCEIEQTGRSGLVGYGRLRQGQVRPGSLLWEQVRGLPLDLTLKIGVEPTWVGAAAALKAVSRVEPVAVNAGESGGKSVDYRLQQQGDKIGLFTPQAVALENTLGPAGESLPAAVERLQPRFKTLLANRILRVLNNGSTSPLKVRMAVQVGGKPVNQVQTRGMGPSASALPSQRLAPGTEIHLEVRNGETQPMHIAVVAVDSDGSLTVLYPADWSAASHTAPVAPGVTLTVPSPAQSFRFVLQPPAGNLEVMTLASTAPLTQSLLALKQIARQRSDKAPTGTPISLDDPLGFMGTMLGDLRSGSTAATLNNSQLAVLSTVIEVG